MKNTMNYKEFMKAVEEKLSIMSENEKIKWVYNIARTTKASERINFLDSLIDNQDLKPIIYKKENIEEWCRKVEEGEIYFECSGYEEYGENYWDNDYVYDYYDIFGIKQDFYKLLKIADDLLLNREYKEALELYERLLNMSFMTIERDAGDWNELELEEIMEEGLIAFDFKQIVLNAMYSTYQSTKGKKRLDKLYNYLLWDKCKNIKIEDIFSIGSEELKDIDIFMEEWISFLVGINGDRAGELLLEACLYQGGISYLCEMAKDWSSRHPVLYKSACEYLLNENKFIECEKLGLEALRVLSENLIIRGEIADLIINAATELKHFEIINKCYEFAFYSNSTLDNYLRLFKLSDHEDITKKAAKYAQTLPKNIKREFNNKNNQMLINSLSKEHKDIIRFFNGEFDYVYDKFKEDNSTLGWSERFKGVVVPLFILLLSKDKRNTKAVEKMVNKIIYRLDFKGNDTEIFLEEFSNWREKIVLPKEQYEKYISWLKEEVDKRTEAVVGGGYRHSYYKAAVLIVALGETLESNGMENGRIIMIEHYKKIHSRKRAFKSELELLNE